MRPRLRRTAAAVLWPAASLLYACTSAPSTAPAPAPDAAPPALAAVREDDLRRDLFALAADTFRGREAGTVDELRAAAWVADRAREIGLAPAGDDGTYFQFFPMRRVRVSDASRVTLGGAEPALWREAAIVFPVDTALDVPLVPVGEGRPRDIAGVDLRGKAAVALLGPPDSSMTPGMSLFAIRSARQAIVERTNALAKAGAAAIVLVADSVAESAFDRYAQILLRGRYAIDSAGVTPRHTGQPLVVLVRADWRDRVLRPGARLVAAVGTESFTYASVNVVATARGSDPSLRGEYVVFSGHHDHDGVRAPLGQDSIYNGADDNGSVSVALLAIGRAWVRQPSKRSALFIWHGAEERGLLGSRWYVSHPTVPRSALVAVLNGDMIGRNHPDSAALLGATGRHRNSAALVAMARAANAAVTRFTIDTTWDDPAHPEFWYFRSDHLPYARAGVPAIYFTTMLHPDYHTPRDDAEHIDYAKLARMARWMYATGWAVANAATRPALDPGFALER
jgi:hypothetical protein